MEGKFSRIALDHNHEQMNAEIKGAGGAIGMTENDAALQRWLVSGPEVARMINEFERIFDNYHDPQILEHHDSSLSNLLKFKQDVKAFLTTGGIARNLYLSRTLPFT